MVILNDDCWRVVFDHLEPETRALYSCLFVSKTFFGYSTRALYRRPLYKFQGQLELSTFSKNHLATLLEIGAGFNIPPPPIPVTTTAVVAEGKQQNPLSSTPSTTATTITTLKTTINYYKLVQEYPAHVSVQRDYGHQWPKYVNCFAETMPFIHFEAKDFDVLLKLVSRFRVLKSVYVNPLPPSSPTTSASTTTSTTSQDDYFTKMIQFIRLHRQHFPGMLSKLETHSTLTSWKESAEVQEAMGGMVIQRIVLQPDAKQDLNGFVFSRLKELNLEANSQDGGLEAKAMELLKRCKRLEKMDLAWNQGKVFDWSVLLVNEIPTATATTTTITNHNVNGEVHGMNRDTVKKQLQPQQPQQKQRPLVNLKHLTVWGNAKVAVEAMKVFKDTLESIEIRWSYNNLPKESFLDWGNLFIMTKLKSIELYQSNLGLENLTSCCPQLETLILQSNENKTSSTWSTLRIPPTIPPTSLLPITIRKLSLKECSADGFDLKWLKPLINLQDLYLETYEHKPFKATAMVNMSKELGWWFPRLLSVAVFGRFAIQIQGQILWVAPRLESLTLAFGFWYDVGPLETDTFLYPPTALDSERSIVKKQDQENRDDRGDADPKVLEEMNVTSTTTTATTRKTTKTTTTATTTKRVPSEASFPALKSLTFKRFQFSDIQMTGQTFGEIFFSPRSNTRLSASNGDDDDEDSDGIIDQKRFLFPNLEHLELDWDQPHGFLESTVLLAMKNMPKLERIRSAEWLNYSRFKESMTEWLQPIPGDQLGSRHEKYRHRPLPAVPAVVTNGSGRLGRGDDSTRVSRCVVEFDRPERIRYQLKAPVVKSSSGLASISGKVKNSKVWRELFSR